MAKIIVTNDDGIHSPGIYVLAEAVNVFGNAYIVAPEKPKSATGLGMTLHKPLRVKRVPGRKNTFSISGTPSDVIHIATNIITGPVDLVVSGVNIGYNTSIQVILSSGTIGAAAQAALMGIPAVAFSMAVNDGEEIEKRGNTERHTGKLPKVEVEVGCGQERGRIC
jgi:5'-nucleotidase